MIPQIKDAAKKYDRTLVAVIVGISMLFIFYLRVGDRIDEVIYQSPVIQRLEAKVEKNREVQETVNVFVEKKLNTIDGKIDRLLLYSSRRR